MIPLPSIERVRDYFRWRQEDARRNALNAHCYWLLRKEGSSVQEATRALEGKSIAGKNELLFSRGINFNDLPAWQKRGIGVWWTDVEKKGFDPVRQTAIMTTRRGLHVECELPLREEYDRLIESILRQ